MGNWKKIDHGIEMEWVDEDTNRYWLVYPQDRVWIASLNNLFSRTPYATKEEAVADVERIIKYKVVAE